MSSAGIGDDHHGGQASAIAADAATRLCAEFNGLDPGYVRQVVLGCMHDLDCAPTGALPELVERLGRQRLLIQAERAHESSHATGWSA